MHASKILLFFAFWVILLPVNAQYKKPMPQAKPPVKTEPMVDKGPLDQQDYKYYFLVRRGSNGNGIYTLKDRPAPATSLNTSLIVMDARTMKELTWWPEIDALVKHNSLYGYTIDRQGSQLVKYTPTGKLLFSKYLTWKTPTGEQNQVLKSGDDKHVYTIYNNDVWIGDFDILTGAIENMHQVTQTGLITDYGYSYMRNDILTIGNYIVNTKSGEYFKSESGASYILSDSCPYFHTPNRYRMGGPVSILYSFDTWNRRLGTEGKTTTGLHWLNREQTKILFSQTGPNGQSSQSIRYYGPKVEGPNNKPIAVTWTEHIATPDGQLWGPLLELAISPKSKYLITTGSIPNTNKSGLRIYNLETLAEQFIPINIGMYPLDETAWADDTHLVFTMRADRLNPAMLNEQTRITTENQGTYILDVETKQVKKITPYLLGDYSTNFVRLLNAKTILFEANNYIFRCNSDGSEFTQLTKIPGVYKLAGNFIK